MQASELITTVLERESLRLLTWADEHAPEAVGRPAVAAAFAHVWPKAASSWPSPDGPVALLLAATERGIKSRPPLIGTYLSETARQTCTVPTLGELHQACQAYAWIGMAAAHSSLSFTRSSMVVAALNVQGLTDMTQRTVLAHRYEPAEGWRVFARLLDVADYLVKKNEAPTAVAAGVARRELERSRRWLATLPARTRA